MQRRPTVGRGSQWPPFGNVPPELNPNWVRVRHCKVGQMGGGEVASVEGGGRLGASSSGQGRTRVVGSGIYSWNGHGLGSGDRGSGSWRWRVHVVIVELGGSGSGMCM